jgi:hypothetical protein
MADITIRIKPLAVPSHAFINLPGMGDGPGGRGDNVHRIPLKDLSEEALDELCQNFRAGVFRVAGKQDPTLPTSQTNG